MTVESAQHPVETGNPHGGADARIDSALVETGAIDGEALTAEQCHILAEAEMIALENLGAVPNLDRPALQAWLDSPDLHRAQAADGTDLICLNSLRARAGVP